MRQPPWPTTYIYLFKHEPHSEDGMEQCCSIVVCFVAFSRGATYLDTLLINLYVCKCFQFSTVLRVNRFTIYRVWVLCTTNCTGVFFTQWANVLLLFFPLEPSVCVCIFCLFLSASLFFFSFRANASWYICFYLILSLDLEVLRTEARRSQASYYAWCFSYPLRCVMLNRVAVSLFLFFAFIVSSPSKWTWEWYWVLVFQTDGRQPLDGGTCKCGDDERAFETHTRSSPRDFKWREMTVYYISIYNAV